MIYYFSDLNRAIVCAGDTVEEFINLVNWVHLNPTEFAFENTEITDLYTDSALRGLALPPLIIQKTDLVGVTNIGGFDLHGFTRDQAIEKSEKMVTVEENIFEDTRTVAERLGINEVDPWDHRTEEEKAKAAEFQAKIDDAKKKQAGREMSGDSFGAFVGAKAEPGVKVLDVHAHQEADGKIVVDKMLAHKKEADTEEEIPEYQLPVEAHIRTFIPAANVTENPMDIALLLGILKYVDHGDAIVFRGPLHILHRFIAALTEHVAIIDDAPVVFNADYAAMVDFAGPQSRFYKLTFETPLAALSHELDEMGIYLDKLCAARGVMPTGCWLASWTKPGAEKVQRRLDLTPEAVLSVVNREGHDAEAKVGEVPVIPPRPWDEDTTAWNALSTTEQEETLAKVKGDEFVVCGRPNGAWEIRVQVVPIAYFYREGRLWEHALPISKLLPQRVEEISPTLYKIERNNWDEEYHQWAAKGFNRDMIFDNWCAVRAAELRGY